MKRTAGTPNLITVSLLLVACDPGMTIRQIKASNGASDPITIEVKTQHPLIGHTWYVCVSHALINAETGQVKSIQNHLSG
jgi:hypothetical protein